MSYKSIMSGELNINNKSAESFDEYPAKIINSLSIRINYLKKEIERTILLNHDCSNDELEFLLKRL